MALEHETEGLLGTLVAESRGRYAVGALRIYADTSVFGGCEDDEFRTPSRRLFEQFRAGAATLLLSEVTVEELRNAPEAVRAIVDQIPEERIERLPNLARCREAGSGLSGVRRTGPVQRSRCSAHRDCEPGRSGLPR